MLFDTNLRASFRLMEVLEKIYEVTRGPWTAMPALIKVDEIRTKLTKKIRYRNYSKLVQFFWEKAQCVCTLVKTATIKALFSQHTTAR